MKMKIVRILSLLALVMCLPACQGAVVIWRYSNFSNNPAMEGTDLFLYARPSGNTNYNITYTQLFDRITNNTWAEFHGITKIDSPFLEGPNITLTWGLAKPTVLTVGGNTLWISGDLLSTNGFFTNITATLFLNATNVWAGPTNTIDIRTNWYKYKTWTPIELTGITGKLVEGKGTQPILLTITNAADTNITIYYTGPIRTGDGNRSWSVTAGNEGKIALEYDPNGSTNLVFRLFN